MKRMTVLMPAALADALDMRAIGQNLDRRAYIRRAVNGYLTEHNHLLDKASLPPQEAVQVTLQPDVADLVQRHAERQGISKGELIRRIAKNFMDKGSSSN